MLRILLAFSAALFSLVTTSAASQVATASIAGAKPTGQQLNCPKNLSGRWNSGSQSQVIKLTDMNCEKGTARITYYSTRNQCHITNEDVKVAVVGESLVFEKNEAGCFSPFKMTISKENNIWKGEVGKNTLSSRHTLDVLFDD